MSDTDPESAASESTESESILQACPGCAALLDVSEEEPFSQVHCPMCGTLMHARTQLKNFILQERVGGGGMGTVYKALDGNLSRLVALKVVRKEFSSDQEYLGKFETEARITASVNHPHVVKVFSFGSDHGLFYIAMELVDKGSLDDLMSLQGRVAEAQVLEVGIQITEGLRAAFLKGLIHRDVKPGNILFADAHTAKIVDFGLALLVEHAAEERGEVWGTPYYVAPEKLNNEPEDFRSDMYSLGATLFHALAGRPPFEAQSASLVALKHIKSKAVSLQAFAPDVSGPTAFVINRMMKKDPNERYQTYNELLEHLSYARAQLLAASGAPRQKARVIMEGKEQQAVMTWITLGLFGVMIVAGVLLFIFRDTVLKTSAPSEPGSEQSAHENKVEPRYQNARRQLLAGDYVGALGGFRQIGDEQGVAQPLGNWATFHEGLCALLGGRLAEARTAFTKLKNRGPFSTDPNAKMLADFFVETSRLIIDGKPVAPGAVKNYDMATCQAIGPLLFALKDWEIARFDDAGPLLAQFLGANPKEPFSWIADYKALAQKYADDYTDYKKLTAKIKAANTLEERADALKAIQSRRAGRPPAGKMNDTLIDLERELQKKISESTIAESRRIAEQRDRDVKTLEAAKVTLAAAAGPYDFEKARRAIASSTVQDSALAQERNVLLKKSDWLVKFKKQLVADVNAAGYPLALVKKNGFRLEGGVKRASDTQVEMVTQYGTLPVLWSDLSPATLIAMASYFTKAATSADWVAERTWLTGVFAFEVGLEQEGRALLIQASQTNAAYRDQLGLFFDASQ